MNLDTSRKSKLLNWASPKLHILGEMLSSNLMLPVKERTNGKDSFTYSSYIQSFYHCTVVNGYISDAIETESVHLFGNNYEALPEEGICYLSRTWQSADGDNIYDSGQSSWPTKDPTDRRLVNSRVLSHLSLKMAFSDSFSYGTLPLSEDVSFHCYSLIQATT